MTWFSSPLPASFSSLFLLLLPLLSSPLSLEAITLTLLKLKYTTLIFSRHCGAWMEGWETDDDSYKIEENSLFHCWLCGSSRNWFVCYRYNTLKVPLLAIKTDRYQPNYTANPWKTQNFSSTHDLKDSHLLTRNVLRTAFLSLCYVEIFFPCFIAPIPANTC
jgi:hypothetical protein